jgi:hypothetical protein
VGPELFEFNRFFTRPGFIIPKGVLPNLKIHETFWSEKRDNREQLPLLAHHPNPHGFWIINFRNNPNLNLVWIVKGFKPLRKNLDNSPKFLLDNVFMNVNLDGLTCMQKFEDIIQVANRT